MDTTEWTKRFRELQLKGAEYAKATDIQLDDIPRMCREHRGEHRGERNQMEQIACHCNFDIPGVDALPSHDHNAQRLADDMLRLNPDNPRVQEIADRMVLRDSVHIWINWKEVAR